MVKVIGLSGKNGRGKTTVATESLGGYLECCYIDYEIVSTLDELKKLYYSTAFIILDFIPDEDVAKEFRRFTGSTGQIWHIEGRYRRKNNKPSSTIKRSRKNAVIYRQGDRRIQNNSTIDNLTKQVIAILEGRN